MRTDVARFDSRAKRIRYLATHFSKFLTGSVLDVGCDQAVLREMLPPGSTYTGIDISGSPDVALDLEEVEALPFDDSAFDLVVCTDVLEHLDNLHAVLGELVRVARRYLIVSLPNNWANARRPIVRGRGRIGHYGLPVHPPADRHKWFFGLSEARDFLLGQAEILPFAIIEMRATEKPRSAVLRCVRRLYALTEERYLNRYAHTLWAVLEKTKTQ